METNPRCHPNFEKDKEYTTIVLCKISLIGAQGKINNIHT